MPDVEIIRNLTGNESDEWRASLTVSSTLTYPSLEPQLETTS